MMSFEFYTSHLNKKTARSFERLRPGDAVCVSLPGDDRLRWLTVAELDWDRKENPIAITLNGDDRLWVCINVVGSIALAQTRDNLH